mgnify:CR=1 FL=1
MMFAWRKSLAVVALTGGLVGTVLGQSSTGPLAVEDRSVDRDSAGDGSSQSGRDDGVMILMQELEQYQRETRKLRNQVEKLQHRLDQMRKAQRERYLDLDTRLNALAEASTRDKPEESSSSGKDEPSDSSTNPQADRQAYQSAKDKLLQRNFQAAAKSFEDYLEDFPDGQFRAYAHFWLGEVYRNMPDRDDGAREQFQVVVNDHPEHSKAPAAMYKLATLQADGGNQGEARVTLEKLRMEFPDSREAELAARMLDELDAKGGGDNGD